MRPRPAEVVDALKRPAFWGLLAFCSVFALIPTVPDTVAQLGDVVLHAGAFLTLAVFGALAYPARSLWLIGLALVGYGALIELLQGLSGLRQPDLGDLIVDVVATGTGLAIVVAFRSRAHRWCRKKPT